MAVIGGKFYVDHTIDTVKRENHSLIENAYKKLAVKEHLSKYRYILNKKEDKKNTSNVTSNKHPNKIWVFWDTEIEDIADPQARKIVKICLESIKKHSRGLEIIVLNDNTVKNYVDIPKHIWDKYKNGIISKQHFSDVVRVYLLWNYGGIWMDASSFLTSDIPDDILNAEFSMPIYGDIDWTRYLSDFTLMQDKWRLNNWFIKASKPRNYLIGCMREFLNEYWKDSNDPIDYFLFHLFLLRVLHEDMECRNILVDNCKFLLSDTKARAFGNKRLEQFTEKEWQELKKDSFLHKLTQGFRRERKITPGSYMDKFLKGELN
ncbi:MAG: capsular polysaccharide synthesis protein [Holosporales bacterium]|nr:capsular polysaccharide synthesis protein [Holosporales bacterium]